MVKLNGPADVVSMVPYLLGYQPVESLVVVALLPPRGRFGPVVRVDLAEPEEAAQLAEFLAATAIHHDFPEALVLAYSQRPELAEAHLAACVTAFDNADIALTDAIRADGSRWWSVLCEREQCCPSTGTPYDAGSSRPAAEAVVAGMQVLPSRESLAARYAPAKPDVLEQVAGEIRRVAAGPMQRPRDVIRERVTEAIESPRELTPVEVAELALATQDIRARDRAWAMMSRETAQRHFDLWSQVTRQVPDDLVPPAGSLAAFAAWLSGNGTLASHGVARVLEASPGYSMAKLIDEALARVVDPRTWDSSAARILAALDEDDPDDPVAG